MDILPGFKLCRKGLHQYPKHLKRCSECNKLYCRAYRQRNLEKRREASRAWRDNNLEKARKNLSKWKKSNKNTVNALNSKRRATQLKALATWADFAAIRNIYEECERRTRETGVQHEVDHIYPLQSKYMCGLHVETNLQILTKEENASKGNRTWPGQLDCQKD